MNKDDAQQAATVSGEICHKKKNKETSFQSKKQAFLTVCNSYGTKIKQDPQPNFLGLAKASWSSLFTSYTVYKSSILIIFMKKTP